MRNAFWAGFVGLVDVDALDGATESRGVVSSGIHGALIVGLAANGVVEDEDFRSAGAGNANVSLFQPGSWSKGLCILTLLLRSARSLGNIHL